jgi:hypothetical protein
VVGDDVAALIRVGGEVVEFVVEATVRPRKALDQLPV